MLYENRYDMLSRRAPGWSAFILLNFFSVFALANGIIQLTMHSTLDRQYFAISYQLFYFKYHLHVIRSVLQVFHTS